MPNSPPQITGEHILVVEDSPSQALLTRRILETSGYQVEVCRNGAIALALIAENHPDLILLDIHLPDMNGRDIAKRVFADPLLVGIPIIFMTGVFKDVADIVIGLEQGAADYILKPINHDELVARVRATLRVRQTQRELGRLAHMLYTVNQVGRQLASILESDILSESIVKLIQENFDYPYVHLFIQEGDDLVLAETASGSLSKRRGAPQRIPLLSSCVVALSARYNRLHTVKAENNEPIFHPFLEGLQANIAAPIHSAGQVIGALEIASDIPLSLTENDGLVIETLADLVGVAFYNSQLYQHTDWLAKRDGLTELLNRRTFVEKLERLWEQTKSVQTPFSLVSVDLDQFKRINDAYGHPTGDMALRAIANLIEGATNAEGFTGRMGGDEFITCLPGIDLHQARTFAEKIAKATRELTVEVSMGDIPPSMTLSIGVVSWPETEANSVDTLLRMVDAALYRAKEGGRDRVSL